MTTVAPRSADRAMRVITAAGWTVDSALEQLSVEASNITNYGSDNIPQFNLSGQVAEALLTLDRARRDSDVLGQLAFYPTLPESAVIEIARVTHTVRHGGTVADWPAVDTAESAIQLDLALMSRAYIPFEAFRLVLDGSYLRGLAYHHLLDEKVVGELNERLQVYLTALDEATTRRISTGERLPLGSCLTLYSLAHRNGLSGEQSRQIIASGMRMLRNMPLEFGSPATSILMGAFATDGNLWPHLDDEDRSFLLVLKASQAF